MYASENVLVNLNKIPTKLVLSTSKKQFQPKESIVFSGWLSDYKDQGIQGSIQISYNDTNHILLTNASGVFTYNVSNVLPYGEYSAYATYLPQIGYESCISETIKFKVNIPTKLSISLKTRNFQVGDTINVRGKLINMISSEPIIGKTIQLYFNNRSIKSAKIGPLLNINELFF